MRKGLHFPDETFQHQTAFRSTFHKPVIYATWNWSRTVEDALHHAGFKDFEEQAKALEAYRKMDF